MKYLLASVLLSLIPIGAGESQAPRDTPPPSIENARRERELRAAAAGNPSSAEAQHRVGVYYRDAARAADIPPAQRLLFILQGIEAEDRALAISPDYVEALLYKNILLRIQADMATDPADRKQLIATATALFNRAYTSQQAADFAARPPSVTAPRIPGSHEPFDLAVARLQPLRVGGSVRTPAKVTDAKPVYPPIAQSARVQGAVVLEVLIDENGDVVNGRVLRSIPLLDAAALAAAGLWQFTPTGLDGRRVAVLMTVTVNFVLQ